MLSIRSGSQSKIVHERFAVFKNPAFYWVVKYEFRINPKSFLAMFIPVRRKWLRKNFRKNLKIRSLQITFLDLLLYIYAMKHILFNDKKNVGKEQKVLLSGIHLVQEKYVCLLHTRILQSLAHYFHQQIVNFLPLDWCII